jgi:hypothetical protein
MWGGWKPWPRKFEPSALNMAHFLISL